MQTSVAVYLPDLNGGGAERVHINLAPALIDRGFDVTFLVHRLSGSFVGDVPSGVRVVELGCDRTLEAFRPLVHFLKKEQPAVLISNMGHSNIIALWAGMVARTRIRIVVSQHSTLSLETSVERRWRFMLLPLMYRLFLHRADGIVAVSAGVAKDIAKVTRIAPNRITTIYNPVITPDFDSRMEEAASHPWLADGGPPFILTAGRLTSQKGSDTVLAAFAAVAQERDVRLIMLGDGPLRATLTASAEKLGLAVCRACSTAWGCKSPAQPDGGEVLAKRKGVAARRGLKEAWSKAAT